MGPGTRGPASPPQCRGDMATRTAISAIHNMFRHIVSASGPSCSHSGMMVALPTMVSAFVDTCEAPAYLMLHQNNSEYRGLFIPVHIRRAGDDDSASPVDR